MYPFDNVKRHVDVVKPNETRPRFIPFSGKEHRDKDRSRLSVLFSKDLSGRYEEKTVLSITQVYCKMSSQKERNQAMAENLAPRSESTIANAAISEEFHIEDLFWCGQLLTSSTPIPESVVGCNGCSSCGYGCGD